MAIDRCGSQLEHDDCESVPSADAMRAAPVGLICFAESAELTPIAVELVAPGGRKTPGNPLSRHPACATINDGHRSGRPVRVLAAG
jgi:hypothetical protein